MEVFLPYLLKSAGLLTLFYLCYHLFLAKETFFVANRYFLFFGILVSFALPLWFLTRTITVAPIVIDFSTISVAQKHTEAAPFDWFKALSVSYFIGFVLMLFNLVIQLFSFRRLITKGNQKKNNGFTFVETTQEVSPFSFFNYIVYNPENYSDQDLKTIIRHEQVHARQKHSVDILFLHLLCAAQWFNPFAWWYKRVAGQNLEYIVDAEVTKTADCKKSYQYLLLNQTEADPQTFTIINPFFNSLIKKRIVMINQKKSKQVNILKLGLVVPFLVLFLFTINTRTIAQSQNTIQSENNPNTNRLKLGPKITKNSTDGELEKWVVSLQEFGIDLNFSNIKRNASNEIYNIKSNFKADNGQSGNYVLNGNDPIQPFYFYISLNDAKKVISAGYETSSNSFPTDPDSTFTFTGTNNTFNTQSALSLSSRLQDTSPIYVINGELQKEGFNMNSLDSNDLKTISVLKGNAATEKYGEKAKHGVVEIQIVTPLYVVDGQPQSYGYKANLNHNTEDIGHIYVLKGELATQKYGEKGANGVIEIITGKD